MKLCDTLSRPQVKCEQRTTQRRNPTFPRPEFPANPYILPSGDILTVADGYYSTMVVNFRRKIRLSHQLMSGLRHYSRISTPRPVGPDPVIRVVNNIAQLGSRKEGPKPRQLLSLPRFPSDPLPARYLTKCANEKKSARVTAISWVKYYFDGVHDSIIQSHFNKNLVSWLLFRQFLYVYCLWY